MKSSRVVGLALLISATAAVSSCSSTSSSTTGGSSTTGSSGASAASAPATASPKTDIRVMVDTTMTPAPSLGGLSFPYSAVGVQAAAAAINASGGIDGHQLKVDVCDNKGDPNASARCGRTAVSNGDIALVGSFDTKGSPTLLPVLEAAKIPYLGGLPSTPQEFNSPVSFQFDPGSTLAVYAFQQLYIDEGCKKVTVVAPQVPGVPQAIAAQRASLAKVGIAQTAAFVTPGVVDIAPVVSQVLANNPDCFTYGGDGQSSVKFISALRKQGYKGQVMAAIGSLTPEFLKILGSDGDGMKVLNSTTLTSADNAKAKQFVTEMTSYLGNDAGKVATNSNEFGQTGWASVQLLKQALTGATDFTAAALLKKLPTMCDVDPGFVYPHVNFCKAAKSSQYSRIFNDYYQYFTAKAGVYTPTDGVWHDLSKTLP